MNNKGTYFGIGIGAGLFVGVIVGMLFAPKSGKETRKFVVEKAKAIKDKLPRHYKNIKEPSEAYQQ